MPSPLQSNYVAGVSEDTSTTLALGTKVVTTTLTADLNAGETDLAQITDGTGSELKGTMVIDDEVIHYHRYDKSDSTSIGDLLRGQEGTADATHLSGATVMIIGAPRFGNPALVDSILAMQDHLADLESRVKALEP